MKHITKILSLSVAIAVVSIMLGCSYTKGPHTNPEVKFFATLSGANEIPNVTTSGTGRFDGTYNKDSKTLQYSITFSGLSGAVTASHIHIARQWENGPVMIAFDKAGTSSITGSLTLTQKQENELLSENTYVNLHTDKNKGGEIRGQVLYVDYIRN
jgi:CHRD domain